MNFLTTCGSLLESKKRGSKINVLKKDRLQIVNDTEKNETIKKDTYFVKFKTNSSKRK